MAKSEQSAFDWLFSQFDIEEQQRKSFLRS